MDNAVPDMKIASTLPDPNELVAFLRQERCIAFVGEDGLVQVIPPPEVDPDDEAAVTALVAAWEEQAA
jgi:hypothetical protein